MNQPLTEQQSSQIVMLRHKGYSIRVIAVKLGLSKWTVEKRLNQERGVTPSIQPPALLVNSVQLSRQPVAAAQTSDIQLNERERQIAAAQKQLDGRQVQVNAQIKAADDYMRQIKDQAAALLNKASAPSPELVARENQVADLQKRVDANRVAINVRIKQLNEYQDQLDSKKKALLTKELMLDQLKNELDQKERSLDIQFEHLARVMDALPDEEQQFAAFRQRDRQEKLVKQYNDLVQEILDNSTDIQWSKEGVDTFLDRAESVKDSIMALSQENGIDSTQLLIHRGLVSLIDEIKGEQSRQKSRWSKSVEFNFSPDHQAQIRDTLVTNFSDKVPIVQPSTGQSETLGIIGFPS